MKLLSAGSYSDEDALNVSTEAYDKRKIRVCCPLCHKVASPLCSNKTVLLRQGLRWVGCSHQEPYSLFKATCGKCKLDYEFTVYTEQ